MANNVLRINGEISSYTVWRVNQFLGDNKGKPVTVRLAAMWLRQYRSHTLSPSMAT